MFFKWPQGGSNHKFTQETGVPPTALWLPKVSVPSLMASLSSWHGTSRCILWPGKWHRLCPDREMSPTIGSHPPQSLYLPAPPHSLPMGRQIPARRWLERFFPLPSYLSQFQEHKDVPINVHHHLRCFHQPSHCVLLCDTHHWESAEEPHE